MFKISFGADNGNQNDRSVNRNSALRAPTLIVSGLDPGYYAVTMIRDDVPMLHWIKCNMPSTIKGGKDVVPYEPPLTDPRVPTLSPMHFVVTLWKQGGGRLSPPPRAPSNRTRFNLARFAKRNKLLNVATVRFFVS